MTLQTREAEKFLLMSMGGRAEGLAFTDLGARTPIGVRGNLLKLADTLFGLKAACFLWSHSFNYFVLSTTLFSRLLCIIHIHCPLKQSRLEIIISRFVFAIPILVAKD